ncbi:MAG: tRNA (adenosine(37)-N6)-threonylcarbamoyltransferase complex dimerization subunit type 1 TsaB [Sneathiella sp.]|nr:tRNA (adenosine(37)-N6)-threonylcarbamoyltransferase complex dimerization subunit type 1 TsaB [Sneathiella sp.]
MKILALDTALNACSVAISEEGTIRAFCHEERSRGHAETLLPLIKTLMAEAQITFDDLDLIAVSVGPGTFTGLRIGLSAARGLSLASGTPCIGVTTLEALAASVKPEIAMGRPIVATADARRKEIYMQSFTYQEKDIFPSQLIKAEAVPIESAGQVLPQDPFVVLGSGAQLLMDAGKIQPETCEILDLDSNPDARLIAAIAEKRGLPPKGTPPPAPVYLRKPDAKLPGGIDPASKT